MSDSYSHKIPTGVHRTEITVINSRFITTIAPAASVDDAKAFIAQIRAEMPDANHHVYAFRIGLGNSIIEGMSDDGEPSGTSGPPTLAVLRGADLGDIVLVTTRYFGGTKLGTGGLVRAYSDAARLGLADLKTEEKVVRKLLGMDIPYHFYEQVKRLIPQHQGAIEEETFAAEVTILAQFPVDNIADFTYALSELSAGCIQPVLLSDN